MSDARELVQSAIETGIPPGREERFRGFALMGMSFASGDVLRMQQFPVASLGTGYTSVWHRDPGGQWTFYETSAPSQGCSRYFGAAVDQLEQRPIAVEWLDGNRLRVTVEAAAIRWDIELQETLVTRVMNVMMKLMPRPVMKNAAVLQVMSRMAGVMLRAGTMRMTGHTPNGQEFKGNPQRMWIATGSASIAGRDLGAPAVLKPQPMIGHIWIPQRPLFAILNVYFEPFDEARHVRAATKAAAAGGDSPEAHPVESTSG